MRVGSGFKGIPRVHFGGRVVVFDDFVFSVWLVSLCLVVGMGGMGIWGVGTSFTTDIGGQGC